MKNKVIIALSHFVTVLACIQPAFADGRQPYVIRRSGEISNLREATELECKEKMGEVISSQEIGPRTSIYSYVNGVARTRMTTAWAVTCRKLKDLEKMPAFVIALNGELYNSTLYQEARDRILKIALKNPNNCASNLLRMIQDYKQDPDVRASMSELESAMGPFSVSFNVSDSYYGHDWLGETSGFAISSVHVLTPSYEVVGDYSPMFSNLDGSRKTWEERSKAADRGCVVEKSDLLAFLKEMTNRMKTQNGLGDVFSSLDNLNSVLDTSREHEERSIASTRTNKEEMFLTASSVDSPELGAVGLAQ
jgi:hypothetical protein